MSFVYAEKRRILETETIIIHCDTKIGLKGGAKAAFSSDMIDLINKYGIVKISILGPAISIAFAGNNIFRAAKLFSHLQTLRTFTVDDAIDKAYNIHISSENISDIEFIICSADNNELRIDCIKDGTIERNCSSAWLGSYIAFRQFQSIRLSESLKLASEMTDTAFETVVQGCKDDSVGGLHIAASYRSDLQSFWYFEKLAIYSDKEQTVPAGEPIRFFLEPCDGGFSFQQIPCNHSNLLLRIDQMDPIILYSRDYRLTEWEMNNDNLNGLMLPMLVKQKDNGDIVQYS